MKSPLARGRPANPARQWVMAVVLGASGGATYAFLDLPLPWMLGALTATMAASLSGLDPAIPRPLRNAMVAVLGVLLGTSFTPELAERMARWNVSLAGMAVGVVAATLLAALYLRRVAGLGHATAYFAAAPGGINEMVVTGGAMGGDEAAIAQIHTMRLLLVVFAVPFAFRLLAHVHGQNLVASLGSVTDMGLRDAAVLAGTGMIGYGLAWAARLPAASLMGPLAASAALHLSSLSTAHPPAEPVIAAQVVLGAGIGCRFRGLDRKALAATMRLSLGSTAITVAVLAGLAVALAAWSDLGLATLVLAFIPGGIAEMSLMAISLGADPAFVSTHHVVRVALVLVLAPLVFRLVRKI
jgi:hypothetical protein